MAHRAGYRLVAALGGPLARQCQENQVAAHNILVTAEYILYIAYCSDFSNIHTVN